MRNDPYSEEKTSLLSGNSESNISDDSSSNSRKSDEPPPPPPPPPPRRFASYLSATSSISQLNINGFNKLGSLDFERIVNDYSIQANRDRLLEYDEEEEIEEEENGIHLPWTRKQKQKNKHLRGYTGRVVTRWALTVLAGILTGLTTVIMCVVVDYGVSWRSTRVERYLVDPEKETADIFLSFSITCVVLAFLSSLLCVAWVPSAAGSGIPEVKAYLNGVRVKKFNSLSLFLVKIVGTILSVSSSLAIGMEGPLIHIGAIVGASCSNLSGLLSRLLTFRPCGRRSLTSRFGCCRNIWLWNSEDLAHFSNDAERRDLISIGAACGFAASFGAPIGGLLFVLDDISSYFAKPMFLRVLVANALGTFCLAWYRGNLSDYAVISLGAFKGGTTEFLNRFEEVPLYIVMGVVGGILGGIFCQSYELLRLKVYGRFSSKTSQLVQIIVLSLVTSVCLFFLPYSLKWSCKEVNIDDDIVHIAATTEAENHRFFCQEGQVNELATILFGSRTHAIGRILSDPTQFQPRTLITVACLFYVLMLFTISSTIPTGVFTPTVLCGAAMGGAAGQLLHDHYDSDIAPSTFALLGVASMLTGIQRSTVSICVILVEGTGQIKVLVPVIVTVIVSRFVANWVHQDGIYETGMRLKGYPYLVHEEKKKWDMFEVRSIMSAPVATVYSREKTSRLVRLLRESSHNGFPVVDKKTGNFLGLVRRKQIVALLECGVFDDNQADDPIRTPRVGESGRDSDENSPAVSTPSSTPFRGVGKEPLMHLAYHIKDDRYDYLNRGENPSMELEDDDFERNRFLLSIREAGDVMRDSMSDFDVDASANKISLLGDDSFPLLNSVNQNFKRLRPLQRAQQSIRIAPTEFADIGQDEAGNVIVKALNPEYRNHYLNLGAVMNKGTYCVPDDFPVSKAYFLFVKLGLRWIVVIGGVGGGQVIGVLTRSSFLRSHIVAQADISRTSD